MYVCKHVYLYTVIEISERVWNFGGISFALAVSLLECSAGIICISPF